MPNRYLRESILSSDPVNSLTNEAEIFYRRLMSKVDDFGLFDARPKELLVSLFGHQLERRSLSEVEASLRACAEAGLLRIYMVDEKPYLEFFKLGEARARNPKFPPPPEKHACKSLKTKTPRADVCKREHAHADANSRAQLRPSSSSSSSSSNPPTPFEKGDGISLPPKRKNRNQKTMDRVLEINQRERAKS